MSLPLLSDLSTLDYAFEGRIFCAGAASSVSDLTTMDYVFEGQPFVRNAGAAAQVSVTGAETLDISDSSAFSLTEAISESVDLSDTLTFSAKTLISDSTELSDDIEDSATTNISEDIDLADDWNVIGHFFEDSALPGDEILILLELYLEDTTEFAESVQDVYVLPAFPEGIDTEDSVSPYVGVTGTETTDFQENLATQLSLVAAETIGTQDSLFLIINFDSQDTTAIEIAKYLQEDDTVIVNILEDISNPISDFSSVDNVYEPTIVKDGSYIVTGASTDPGVVVGTNIYVNIRGDIAVPGGMCNLISWNISLDFSGGSFTVNTISSTGIPAGTPFPIFGLLGTVTESGVVASTTAYGYVLKGIFGATNKLNRPIQLMANLAELHLLLPIPSLAKPSSKQWRSISGIAKALANAAGIGLFWNTNDSPVTDLFPATGQTVISALSTLAARVGGIFVFNGLDKYIVTDPIMGVPGGTGLIPDCATLMGLEITDLIDLASDNIVIFPVDGLDGSGGAQFPPKINPNDVTNLDRVIPLFSTRSKLEAGQPETFIRLPGDVFELKAQIVVPEGSATTGTYITPSGPQPDLPAWTTFATTPVQMADGTKAIKLTSVDFPPTLDSGEFSFNVGYTRDLKKFAEQFNTARDEAAAVGRFVLNEQQEQIRYVKVKHASATFPFMGFIPLPGQHLTLTTPGAASKTINGIIENVSITSPGIVNISVGEYKRLNFINPRDSLTALKTL